VSRDGSGGGRVDRCLHRHVGPLDAEKLVEIEGIAVTSLARTVVALARTVGFEQAVVVGDGALAALPDPLDLEDALDRAAGWRGTPAARRVVAFGDGRSGSVGESRSRIALETAGLPLLRESGPGVTRVGARCHPSRGQGAVESGPRTLTCAHQPDDLQDSAPSSPRLGVQFTPTRLTPGPDSLTTWPRLAWPATATRRVVGRRA